eukprot:UN00785
MSNLQDIQYQQQQDDDNSLLCPICDDCFDDEFSIYHSLDDHGDLKCSNDNPSDNTDMPHHSPWRNHVATNVTCHYDLLRLFFTKYLITTYHQDPECVFILLFILLFKVNNIQTMLLCDDTGTSGQNNFRLFLTYLFELNKLIYTLPQMNNTDMLIFQSNSNPGVNKAHTQSLSTALNKPRFNYFVIYITTLYEFFYSLLFLPTTTTAMFNVNDVLSIRTIINKYNIYDSFKHIKNKTNLMSLIQFFKFKAAQKSNKIISLKNKVRTHTHTRTHPSHPYSYPPFNKI